MTEKELQIRVSCYLMIARIDQSLAMVEWLKLINDCKGGITDDEGRVRYIIGDSKADA